MFIQIAISLLRSNGILSPGSTAPECASRSFWELCIGFSSSPMEARAGVGRCEPQVLGSKLRTCSELMPLFMA